MNFALSDNSTICLPNAEFKKDTGISVSTVKLINSLSILNIAFTDFNCSVGGFYTCQSLQRMNSFSLILKGIFVVQSELTELFKISD